MNAFELKGKTIKSFERSHRKVNKQSTAIERTTGPWDTVSFVFDNGDRAEFYHSQDCCETVELTRVFGNVENLVGEPLTIAEDDHPSDPDWHKESYDEHHTWTRYRFGTLKGIVEFWWLGESSGYYGEDVDLKYTKGTP
jgi:hypothetical protein